MTSLQPVRFCIRGEGGKHGSKNLGTKMPGSEVYISVRS